MRKTTTTTPAKATTTTITTSSTDTTSGTTTTTTTTLPQSVMSLPRRDRDLTAARIIIKNNPTLEDIQEQLVNIVDNLLDDQKESALIIKDSVINVFNIGGDNARVYMKSQDQSVNVNNLSPAEVFKELRNIVSEEVKNLKERSILLSKINELEETKGTTSFAQKYSEFISLAADHLTLLTPILPALTQWLGGLI
jgi:hypothetical protein